MRAIKKLRVTLRIDAEVNSPGSPYLFSNFRETLREKRKQPRRIWNIGYDKFKLRFYYPTEGQIFYKLRSPWGETRNFYIKDKAVEIFI